MKVIDLITPLRGYANKWVVLSDNQKKVLVSADSLKTLLKEAEKKKIKGGVMMKVARDYSHYIGSI